MLGSKTNRITLYVSAFLVIALVLFAILRDRSNQITLEEAYEILGGTSVEHVVATKDYVYLKTNEEIYKIASSQVTPKMFSNHKVEVGNETNFLLYFLYIILILGVGSLLWFKPKFIQPCYCTK